MTRQSATLLAQEKQIDAQNALISELNKIKQTYQALDQEHTVLQHSYESLKNTLASLSTQHEELKKKFDAEASRQNAHVDALK